MGTPVEHGMTRSWSASEQVDVGRRLVVGKTKDVEERVDQFPIHTELVM